MASNADETAIRDHAKVSGLRTFVASGSLSFTMHRQTFHIRLLGWGFLVFALPLAWIGATHPANEYKATLGINAIDCNGPAETYMFAAPALLIYVLGFIGNGIGWKNRHNLIVSMICFCVCICLATNYYRAMLEDRAQKIECQGD